MMDWALARDPRPLRKRYCLQWPGRDARHWRRAPTENVNISANATMTIAHSSQPLP